MRFRLILILIILSPFILSGCLALVFGPAGLAADVAIQVLPTVIKHAPDMVEAVKEAFSDGATNSKPVSQDIVDKTDKEICSLATLNRASEWDFRPRFTRYAAEAGRRNLTLQKCQFALGFASGGLAVVAVAQTQQEADDVAHNSKGADILAEVARSKRRASETAELKPTESEKETDEKKAREQKLADAQATEKRRKMVLQAQAALTALGLYRGKIDGIHGPKTREAVAKWFRGNSQSQFATLTEKIAAQMRRQAKTTNVSGKSIVKIRQKGMINEARQKNKQSIAVIIGNSDYTGRTPAVSFAGNDADAMRQFLISNLGYREGNIIDLRNASLTQFNATFGTASNHRGRLYDYVRADVSDVIVFYSGHGVPGLRDHRSYLLPVDADPNHAELNGYSLDTLLANLAKIPARSTAVYIDACFSGESQKGMLVQAMSGISVEAVPPRNKRNRLLDATSGNREVL